MLSVNGVLNGVTEVELVSAPSSGTKRVVFTNISNVDSAAVVLNFYLKDGSNYRRIWKGGLLSDVSFCYGRGNEVVVLDTSSKSLVAWLGAAVASSQPEFICNVEID